MRTSDSALEVFSVNVLQAIPRPMSYLLSGRYFKVLGLFLIGLLLDPKRPMSEPPPLTRYATASHRSCARRTAWCRSPSSHLSGTS